MTQSRSSVPTSTHEPRNLPRLNQPKIKMAQKAPWQQSIPSGKNLLNLLDLKPRQLAQQTVKSTKDARMK
ncbi:hypothetical protein PtB15_13B392 [Puccinia triticina]|nr:hypothetical protein PtB15_13B392 [Puccinia triticina]